MTEDVDSRQGVDIYPKSNARHLCTGRREEQGSNQQHDLVKRSGMVIYPSEFLRPYGNAVIERRE